MFRRGEIPPPRLIRHRQNLGPEDPLSRKRSLMKESITERHLYKKAEDPLRILAPRGLPLDKYTAIVGNN